MTAPHQPYPPQQTEPEAGAERPRLLRWAIWVAIGALILAAIVCVIWVLIGPENGIIGRAFLTILLLAAFAGVAILDTSLAPRRPPWFALTSMITWVVTLLLGAFLIWMPADRYGSYDGGFGRFASFLGIVLVLQLALLHVRLFSKSVARHRTGFNQATGAVTIGLVALLALMLVLPLTFHEFIDFEDLYWRIVVAVAILAAVGTALVPLVNALFAPKRERPAPPYAAVPGYPGYGAPQAYPQGIHPPQPQPYPGQAVATPAPAQQPWPTFVDGVTPLPVMPDGSPDWNAYYTGYPSVPQHPAPEAAPQAQAPQSPAPQSPAPQDQAPQSPPAGGHPGFPPPPPLPPQ
ncbi:hypothetical protein [Microbacterium sp. P04]|uniref:hypothetical protein n=1 Tax=Microbacterium sp. P04 TaxID=3366947 RepID=UPI00374601DE